MLGQSGESSAILVFRLRELVRLEMETDDYSNRVFTCLDALSESRTDAAIDGLDDYQREVLECFRTLIEGPANVPMAHMDALLKRCDDLIDTGTDLGVKAAGLVETLYEVHGSIANEMEKGFNDPESREVLRRYVNVRSAQIGRAHA